MMGKRWMAAGLVVLAAVAFGERDEEIRPIPLGEAANAARIDNVAADGKGGWLDLGSNDLHVLPTGRRVFGGVPFELPPDAGEAGKTCLVLGRSKDVRSAAVAVSGDNAGGALYLLHAVADAEELRIADIGSLEVTYADGTTERQTVKGRYDVSDWTSGRSFKNCVRVWSEYNDNTQVSLFVSKFAVRADAKLTRIAFAASGKCPWMIVGLARGKSVPVKRIEAPQMLTTTYRLPPAPEEKLPMPTPGQRPKNVVLIIGDGMGAGALDFCSRVCRKKSGALLVQQLPVETTCTTVSVEGQTTDSAAAATALATGSKTMNGMLGLCAHSDAERKNPTRLVPFTERMQARGISVGLFTNDPLFGATPSGFYAHVVGRGEMATIADQAAASGYALLIGSRNTLRAFTVTNMTAHGYVAVTTPDAFRAAAPEAKVFGALSFGGDEEGLSRGVAESLKRLSRNEKGFFLMAESATPDHGGHGNVPADSVLGVAQVEWMVKTALDFAAARGDTLLLVTGDHETGGMTNLDGEGLVTRVTYTTTSHTTRPVAFFAYGPGAERFARPLDNTDIAKTISALVLDEGK